MAFTWFIAPDPIAFGLESCHRSRMYSWHSTNIVIVFVVALVNRWMSRQTDTYAHINALVVNEPVR